MHLLIASYAVQAAPAFANFTLSAGKIKTTQFAGGKTKENLPIAPV